MPLTMRMLNPLV